MKALVALDVAVLAAVAALLRRGCRAGRASSLRARLAATMPAGMERTALLRIRRVDGDAIALGATAAGALSVALGLTGALPAIGAVLGAAAIAALSLVRWARRLGEGARVDRALAPVAEQLGRQLRSGASLPAAFVAVAADAPAELAGELRGLSSALNQGATMTEALRGWRAGRPRASVALLSAALGIGHAHGGLRAQSVEELAAWLREADETQREAVAQAGQAQASAVVMVVAPVAFAVLLAAGDDAARQFLLHSTAGACCVALALALDLGAAALMVRAIAGFGREAGRCG